MARISRAVGLSEIPAVTPASIASYAARPDAKCWVYEVWDTQGRLAYVGIADDFPKRWAQHKRMSWWMGEIDIWYVDLLGFRSRWEARQVEAATIHGQNPVYNTAREETAYAGYLGLYSDPSRPVDEFDCIPVKRVRYEPREERETGHAVVQS